MFKPSVMVERGGVEIAHHRPGPALYADRQSALDDPELVVRHPRGRSAQARSRSVRKDGAAARGAAVAQRLRRRSQAAGRVAGIDVILTAHTHDALPEVGQGRQDAPGRLRQPRQVRVAARPRRARRRGEGLSAIKLIPVFADAIAPDAEMAAKIAGVRAPHEAMLREVDRADRDAALPARQLQRHARRR